MCLPLDPEYLQSSSAKLGSPARLRRHGAGQRSSRRRPHHGLPPWRHRRGRARGVDRRRGRPLVGRRPVRATPARRAAGPSGDSGGARRHRRRRDRPPKPDVRARGPRDRRGDLDRRRLAPRVDDVERAQAGERGAEEGGAASKYVHVEPVRTGDELEDLANGFNRMVDGLKERDNLRTTFGKYMTASVMDHLLAGKVSLGGESLKVTILFTDIRSFTSISEKMDPQHLVGLLNEYFSEMVAIVMDEGGVVDKYIGDGIMARHLRRACAWAGGRGQRRARCRPGCAKGAQVAERAPRHQEPRPAPHRDRHPHRRRRRREHRERAADGVHRHRRRGEPRRRLESSTKELSVDIAISEDTRTPSLSRRSSRARSGRSRSRGAASR